MEEVQQKRLQYFPSDIYSEALIPYEVLPSDPNDVLVSLVDKLNLNFETDVKATKLAAASAILEMLISFSRPMNPKHLTRRLRLGRRSWEGFFPDLAAQRGLDGEQENGELNNYQGA